MEDPNIVDEFFKRRLQQAEEELPASSWQVIKDKLPSNSFSFSGRNSALSKKNIIGVVLLLLVFSSTFWYAIDLRNKNFALKNKLNERLVTLAQDNYGNGKIVKNEGTQVDLKPSNTNFKFKRKPNFNNKSEADHSSAQKSQPSLSGKDKYIHPQQHKSITRLDKKYSKRVLIKDEDQPLILLKNMGRRSRLNSKKPFLIVSNKVLKDVKRSRAKHIVIDEESFVARNNPEKSKPHLTSSLDLNNTNAHSPATNDSERNDNLRKEGNISSSAEENNNSLNTEPFKMDSIASAQTSKASIGSTTNISTASFKNDTLSNADSLLAKDNKDEKIIVKEKQKDKVVSNKSGISVEYFLAPDLAYSSVAFSGAPLSKAAQEYKKNDQNRVGFSTGLLLNFNLYKRLYIQTGLIYSNAGDKNNSNYQWKKTDTTLVGYNIMQTNGEIGVTAIPADYTDAEIKAKYINPNNSTLTSSSSKQDPNSQDKITSYQTYENKLNAQNTLVYQIKVNEYVNSLNQQAKNSINYFGIPLVIGTRQVLSKRFSVGIFSGVITNILVSPRKIKAYSYLENEYSEKIIEKEIALNKLNFVYWGGVDICYKISPQWSIRVAPVVKHALNSLYKDEAILRQVPYSYGIQLGIKYVIRDDN